MQLWCRGLTDPHQSPGHDVGRGDPVIIVADAPLDAGCQLPKAGPVVLGSGLRQSRKGSGNKSGREDDLHTRTNSPSAAKFLGAAPRVHSKSWAAAPSIMWILPLRSGGGWQCRRMLLPRLPAAARAAWRRASEQERGDPQRRADRSGLPQPLNEPSRLLLSHSGPLMLDGLDAPMVLIA